MTNNKTCINQLELKHKKTLDISKILDKIEKNFKIYQTKIKAILKYKILDIKDKCKPINKIMSIQDANSISNSAKINFQRPNYANSADKMVFYQFY